MPDRLPPLGYFTRPDADHTKGTGYVAYHRQESRVRRDPWLGISDEAGKVFVYGTTDWPPKDPEQIILNDIQNVVLNGVEQEAGDHPRPTITPVDTGAAGPWVFNGSPRLAAQLGIPLPGTDPSIPARGSSTKTTWTIFCSR